MNRTQRLLVLAGPTGTGKSALSLGLAERLGGEIVNADSMQLYRGMDIGTAKVPVPERRGIVHHLLDVLDIADPASVAVYQQQARTVIEDVLRRGRLPILVGGSGLYVSAVVDEIDFPGVDPVVRAELEAELAAHGVAALHAQLQQVDPVAAAAVEPGNGRRIVRALEVIAVTGAPFRATLPPLGRPRFDAALLFLDRDTAELDDLLARRVDAMLAAGFLAEVTALAADGLRESPTASRALGYRQLLSVLDGRTDLRTARTDTVTATRQFVRRQRSWFRRDQRFLRLTADAPDLMTRALAALSAPTGEPRRSEPPRP